MTKRQEAKRAVLTAELEAKGYMTVADLRALLATYPRDAPVTGYNAHEETSLVLPRSISMQDDEHVGMLIGRGYTSVSGPFLDIMGTR